MNFFWNRYSVMVAAGVVVIMLNPASIVNQLTATVLLVVGGVNLLTGFFWPPDPWDVG